MIGPARTAAVLAGWLIAVAGAADRVNAPVRTAGSPTVDEPLGANRRWAVVDNAVYHAAERPSALTLWLGPR